MLKTPLYDQHCALGAKRGAFAGYDMPLFYPAGVLHEHLWTRDQAGLFDVSHMGQIILAGDGMADLLESLTPSAIAALRVGQARYTVLMNDQGGIVDDLIITRLDDHRFFAVINAGCTDKDCAWIAARLKPGMTLDRLDDRALLALQGPMAETVLTAVLGVDLQDLGYMQMMHHDSLMISRLGYTGEDGFEISIPSSQASDLWTKLMADPRVRPVGLAARDSLRLEMGYPLYGHDIDDTTSPLEADLGWIIRKHAPPSIPAPARKRVGIRLQESGIARDGTPVFVGEKNVGTLCSGGYSPVLKGGIAMAYLPLDLTAPHTPLMLEVRGRHLRAAVAPLPFVPAKTRNARTRAA